MKYLLDTDMCVFALRNKPRIVAERIQQHSPDDIVISAITVAELRYGADKCARPEDNHEQLSKFLLTFDILFFDSGAADAYGEIRADLERRGQQIGSLDMLLAAHALSQGLIFVTHNTAEFQRVNGLQLEDWFA